MAYLDLLMVCMPGRTTIAQVTEMYNAWITLPFYPVIPWAYVLVQSGTSHIILRPGENSEHIKDKPRSRTRITTHREDTSFVRITRRRWWHATSRTLSPLELGTLNLHKDNETSTQKKTYCAQKDLAETISGTMTQRCDDIKNENEDHFCMLFIGRWVNVLCSNYNDV